MQMRAILLAYVWPEVDASAAGWRSENLIQCLEHSGYTVAVWSHAADSEVRERWERRGNSTRIVKLNCEGFNAALLDWQPDLILFDRFLTEEQFSWRVRETLPNCLRIIDTQDLHFLRHHRESEWHARKAEFANTAPATTFSAQTINTATQAKMLRELGAILRSDLTLVLSAAEMEILQGLAVPAERLFYFPLCSRADSSHFANRAPSERSDLAFIGNFRHPPNADAIEVLISKIWPEIRAKHPSLKLHIAGAYPSKDLSARIRKSPGVVLHNQVPDAHAFLSDKLALLAPLRFGAGLKGKILDAWRVGTAVLTTSIGAEGLFPGENWPGIVEDNFSDWADCLSQLQANQTIYPNAAAIHLEKYFNSVDFFSSFAKKLHELRKELGTVRSKNWLGELLWTQQLRSTEFFSRWIEARESQKQNSI